MEDQRPNLFVPPTARVGKPFLDEYSFDFERCKNGLYKIVLKMLTDVFLEH